jgi:eukaryotic-like serine/threonine-protein kinase
MGLIAFSRGRWDDALRVWDQAHALNVAHYGPDHVEVAITLNNRGVVLMERGEADAALSAHQAALAIRERQLGKRHILVGHSLREIASVRRQQFEATRDEALLDEALTLDQRARSIAEAAFQTPHPEIAFAINCVALDLHKLGRLREAEEHHVSALAMYRSYYSKPNADIVRSLLNLGRVQLQRGRLDEARSSFDKAIRMSDQLGTPRTVHVGRALDGLGEVFQAEGKVAKAVAYFEDAIEVFEDVLGTDAPTTRNTAAKLTSLLGF